MTIIKDPEGNETATLRAMVDLAGLSVLEVGCGEGRLTWRYASEAAHVTAIDPDGKAIETARTNLPEKLPVELQGQVTFLESTIDDFARSSGDRRYDLAIYSWSL